MKESEIQSAIIDYLEILEQQGKIFFHRVNNIPPVNKIKGKITFRKLPRGVKRGFPDILIIKQGKCIGIEIKNEKGQQSEYQTAIEKQFKNNCAEYYVVRSVEEVRKILM